MQFRKEKRITKIVPNMAFFSLLRVQLKCMIHKMFKSFEAVKERLYVFLEGLVKILMLTSKFSQRTLSEKPLENTVIEIPRPLKTFPQRAELSCRHWEVWVVV